jgi:hypothetical protein
MYLFFRPTERALSNADVNFVPNPLIAKHFKHILNQDLVGRDRASKPTMYYDNVGYNDISRVERMGLSIADIEGQREKHKSFIRGETSWRKMLPSQPPPRKIGYITLTEKFPIIRGVKPPPAVTAVNVPDGLRMGQL